MRMYLNDCLTHPEADQKALEAALVQFFSARKHSVELVAAPDSKLRVQHMGQGLLVEGFFGGGVCGCSLEGNADSIEAVSRLLRDYLRGGELSELFAKLFGGERPAEDGEPDCPLCRVFGVPGEGR